MTAGPIQPQAQPAFPAAGSSGSGSGPTAQQQTQPEQQQQQAPSRAPPTPAAAVVAAEPMQEDGPADGHGGGGGGGDSITTIEVLLQTARQEVSEHWGGDRDAGQSPKLDLTIVRTQEWQEYCVEVAAARAALQERCVGEQEGRPIRPPSV